MVICQGCGQSFAVPAGYGRNKIQCPACGVICAVPAGAARGEPTPAGRAKKAEVGEDAAACMLDDAVPMFDDEPAPAPKAAPPPPKTRPADERVNCRRCGRLIARQRECPSCDEMAETSAEAANDPAPLSLSLDETAPSLPAPAPGDEEDDESPYSLADKDIPLCPKCRKPMAVGAVLCTACGFDTKTRKKARRTFDPIARVWETNQTIQQRLIWFGLAQGVHWSLAVVSLLSGYGVTPFVISWPLLVGMLAFVLGTYERVQIVRDGRGRCEVTSAWRFAFWPLAPRKTEIRGFEGVTTGQDHEIGILEWMICASLLCAGVVPAFVWWYVVINKPNFHVALATDHGHAEVYVYRGKSEEQMQEIGRVLVTASGLQMLS